MMAVKAWNPFTLMFLALGLIAAASTSFGKGYLGAYMDYFLVALLLGVLWYFYDRYYG